MSTAWWVWAATRIWAFGSRFERLGDDLADRRRLARPRRALHDEHLVGFARGGDGLLLAVVEVQVVEPVRPARGRPRASVGSAIRVLRRSSFAGVPQRP